jgi:glycosyltransferase involved in cell wall biosynthesis
MSTPLISVVIPTAGRPNLLPRAVDSALAGMEKWGTEVIVVPNGSDISWQVSLSPWRGRSNVRILPIDIGHANIARNHGLANARGKYVRFLDDDDYLISDAACAQLEFAIAEDAEFCSGRLANVDADGVELGMLSFPGTRDFVSAVFDVGGLTIPSGNLILRECLVNSAWNVAISRGQDYVWMLHLAGLREWRWRHFDRVVGVWWQHPGQRVSTVYTASYRPYEVIEQIWMVHWRLVAEGRMNGERANAIAEALWHYVHRFFPYAPRYWCGVARRARQISQLARPRHPLFNNNALLRSIDPLQAEWLMFPLRLVSINSRRLWRICFRADYRRRL